jgi:hypothetical protein
VLLPVLLLQPLLLLVLVGDPAPLLWQRHHLVLLLAAGPALHRQLWPLLLPLLQLLLMLLLLLCWHQLSKRQANLQHCQQCSKWPSDW